MVCEKNLVYVVDPDEAVHDALTTLFGAAGTRVLCYVNAEAFLESGISSSATDGLVLTEASLPGMGSLALLRSLRDMGLDLPVVVMTSTSIRGVAEQAIKAGAVEVIEKPLLSDRLLQLLRELPMGTICPDTTIQ